MDDLQIYITIEKPMTDRSLRITGDIELLRAFLSGVGGVEFQSFPPCVDPSPVMPTQNKRNKSAKETVSTTTA